MHDPLTLIGSLWGFDLWHRDPPARSCGWWKPYLTDAEVEAVTRVFYEEIKSFFTVNLVRRALYPERRNFWMSKVGVLEGIFGIMELVVWRVWRKHIRPRHIPFILSLAFDSFDNLKPSFAPADSSTGRGFFDENEIKGTFLNLARLFKMLERPWYRHPRWHFWHWRIVFVPLRGFKRWAFSRCVECGGRFGWGAVQHGDVVSLTQGGGGPAWFRNGERIVHPACRQPAELPTKPNPSSETGIV